MVGVFTEQKEMIEHMLDPKKGGNLFNYVFIIFFLFVASYTVLNMLIGVICEVISEVAHREKEEILQQDLRAKIRNVTKLLSPYFPEEDEDELTLDLEKEVMVSREIYERILEDPEAAQTLAEVGVDVLALADMSDYVFPQSGQIELTDFLQLILQFRGSNTATVKDMVEMRKILMEE